MEIQILSEPTGSKVMIKQEGLYTLKAVLSCFAQQNAVSYTTTHFCSTDL